MTASRPDLSLAALADALLLADATLTLARLADLGCRLTGPDAPVVQPLLGDLEAVSWAPVPVRVDGVEALLLVELTRRRKSPQTGHIGAFELRSPVAGDRSWLADVRRVLEPTFEPLGDASGEPVSYRWGSVLEAILVDAGPAEPTRLLLRRRSGHRRRE